MINDENVWIIYSSMRNDINFPFHLHLLTWRKNWAVTQALVGSHARFILSPSHPHQPPKTINTTNFPNHDRKWGMAETKVLIGSRTWQPKKGLGKSTSLTSLVSQE